MDYRTDSFVRRFNSAKSHLAAKNIQHLVSLKYRQSANGSDYVHFIDDLKRNSSLGIQRVDGSFGGQAWLVTDKDQNETGLEILGAIGSIATLIALLPMISSGWARLRHRFFGPHYDRPDAEGIEVRRIDVNGSLIEQQLPSVEVYVLNAAIRDYSRLTKRVNQLEDQVRGLKVQVPESRQKPRARPKRGKLKKK